MKLLSFKNLAILGLTILVVILWMRSQKATQALKAKCSCNGSSGAITADSSGGSLTAAGGGGSLADVEVTTADDAKSEGLVSTTTF